MLRYNHETHAGPAELNVTAHESRIVAKNESFRCVKYILQGPYVNSTGATQDTVVANYAAGDKMHVPLSWQPPQSVTLVRSSSVANGRNICLPDDGYVVQRPLSSRTPRHTPSEDTWIRVPRMIMVSQGN